MFSWAPYLLNQFLIDYGDAQEPKFSLFVYRKGKCYASRYETLWKAKDTKNQQANSAMFSMFLEYMYQKTTNVWRFLVDVVQENVGNVRFEASK
jgi:hypothetical protein